MRETQRNFFCGSRFFPLTRDLNQDLMMQTLDLNQDFVFRPIDQGLHFSTWDVWIISLTPGPQIIISSSDRR
jgi:hypothetical protein